MRVFVTGATGFIGSAIVQELLSTGHQVLGLARSDARAADLAQLGIEAHRGDLSDIESLVAGARVCDGVIHTAFNHDWSVAREVASDTDVQAVNAMLGAFEGTGKPVVIASGTALLSFSFAPGHIGTEEDAVGSALPRAASEDAVLAYSGRGVRGSIVRLPPTVHGAGDHGFVPMVIETGRKTGVAAYVGDGANRWPAVHRLDAARLFRLALEGAAPGSVLHCVAEEGVSMRSIAETIGTGLGIPVKGVSPEEAAAHFTWMAHFIAMDNPTSSAVTREALGWTPQGPDLLTDLRENGYFA